MSLTSHFSDMDGPPTSGEPALRKFPVEETDFDAWRAADASGREALARFRESVSRRKPVGALNLADFDHDGWATEFVFQVGTLACGERQSILVGLSRERPSLHVFTTTEQPESPLVLRWEHWEELRTKRSPIRVVSWACGDHASEEQEELVLSVDRKGFHVVRETFACDEVAGTVLHERLLKREVL